MDGSALHVIPPEPGRGRAIVLALTMHLGLLLFLWMGISWQSEPPSAVEAEVWDVQAREAAPKASAPASEPEPAEKLAARTPAPEPKVAPREMQAKPDIALEREKKRREEAQKKADEAQRKADEAKRLKAEKQAREAEEKRQKLEKAQAAKNKRRAGQKGSSSSDSYSDELNRAMKYVGSGGNGTAPRSTGNNRGDVGYVQKVSAKIKSNTAFTVPRSLNGNPAVEYSVELLPDGELRSTPRKLKSSGIPGFDEAVLRAIERSAPYPADRTGRVPPSFIVSHKPKG